MIYKPLAILSVSLVLFTVSCSSSTNEGNRSLETTKPKQADQKPKNQPQKDKNGRYVLNEVGQKITSEDGTKAELIKMKKVNETVDMGPIKLLIKDIKIIQMTNISKDLTETLKLVEKRELPETVNYIQVNWEAENKEDKTVSFNGFDNMVLNTKKQYSFGRIGVFSDQPDLDYIGKVKQKGSLRKVIEDSPNEITNVKLVTSNVFDSSSLEEIKDAQIVEYKFDN